jgi:hypothetical protein
MLAAAISKKTFFAEFRPSGRIAFATGLLEDALRPGASTSELAVDHFDDALIDCDQEPVREAVRQTRTNPAPSGDHRPAGDSALGC